MRGKVHHSKRRQPLGGDAIQARVEIEKLLDAVATGERRDRVGLLPGEPQPLEVGRPDSLADRVTAVTAAAAFCGPLPLTRESRRSNTGSPTTNTDLRRAGAPGGVAPKRLQRRGGRQRHDFVRANQRLSLAVEQRGKRHVLKRALGDDRDPACRQSGTRIGSTTARLSARKRVRQVRRVGAGSAPRARCGPAPRSARAAAAA